MRQLITMSVGHVTGTEEDDDAWVDVEASATLELNRAYRRHGLYRG